MEIKYTNAAENDVKKHLDKAKAFSIYLYETKKHNLKTEIENLTPERGEPLSKFLEQYIVDTYHVTPDYRVSFVNPFLIFFQVGNGKVLIIRVYDRMDEDRDWMDKITELFTLLGK